MFGGQRNIFSVKEYLSTIGQKSPRDRVEHRGFARAVCSDNGDEIAFRNFKTKIVEGEF